MARASSAVVESCVQAGPLSQEELDLIDTYWRAANYLSVADDRAAKFPKAGLARRRPPGGSAGCSRSLR